MSEQQTDAGGDQSNLLSLKWNNHLSNFKGIIASLQEKSILSDATLACDGQLFPVHKLVLSTCSEFFGRVFSSTPCKHPVIVLHDLQPQHLHYLLSYMYAGEVNVPQAHLPTLIRAAETLQIKGLAAPDEEPHPIHGLSQSLLTDNRVKNEYYSANSSIEENKFNKSAGSSTRLSSKRRRGLTVDEHDEVDNCDEDFSTESSREDINTGDGSLNPSSVKRSRKHDANNHDLGREKMPEDVKEETLLKSSSDEQVDCVKEECDISGSNDARSFEEGVGGWIDAQGAVDWPNSSGQQEGPAVAMPWIPFSSASSTSAQDCKDSSSISLNYNSQYEPSVDASNQANYTSLPPSDYSQRIAGSSSTSDREDAAGYRVGNGVRTGCASSNNCITSDPQLLSVVGRFSTAGEAGREALSSITTSNCESDLLSQGVGRSRNVSNSHIGSSKSNHSVLNRRQSLVYTGNNSASDVHCLLSPDAHFMSSESNTLGSEIFSNIIGVTGGTPGKGGGGGGVVSTSCGLLHECPVCPKTFQSRADVVRHLRTHTGERPYKCPHCQYRAALKGNLKSHILSRHSPEKGAIGALLEAVSVPK